MNRALGLVALVGIWAVAVGATYNIDNTGAGDWVSWTQATGIAAGDSILFKRGQIFRACAYEDSASKDSVWTVTYDGTVADTVVIGAYGAGDDPIITGARSGTIDGISWNLSTVSSGSESTWYATRAGGADSSYRTPYRLFDGPAGSVEFARGDSIPALADGEYQFGDADGLGYSAIYIRDDSGAPPTTIEIPQFSTRFWGLWVISPASYLEIRDLTFQHTNLADSSDSVDGFKFGSKGMKSGSCEYVTYRNLTFRQCVGTGANLGFGSNTTIDSCTFTGNIGDGLGIGGDSTGGINDSLIVTNCTFSGNGHFLDAGYDSMSYFGAGSGMKTFCIENAVIESNLAFDNDTGGLRMDGNPDGGCDSSLVRWNTCYGNGFAPDQGAGGITLEYCRNMSVKHNLVYDNYSYNILVSLCDLRVAQPVPVSSVGHDTVAYNVLRSGASGTRGVLVDNNTYNTVVMNNTIDSTGWGVVVDWQSTNNATLTLPHIVKNNIITNSSFTDISVTHDSMLTQGWVVLDYNLLTGDGSNTAYVAVGGGGGYATLSAWQADPSSPDANSIDSDPLYEDEAAEDLRLGAGSPAFQGGDPVNTLPDWKDYAGNPSYGRPPIGAYEYQYTPTDTTDKHVTGWLRLASRKRGPLW